MMIADLHCDLLCYLQRDPKRTPHDRAVRCSIPQLREGGVKVQTMAIFSETTPGSSENGWAQAEIFRQLSLKYSDDFFLLRKSEDIEAIPLGKIGIIPAIESMSALCGEKDDLEAMLERVDLLLKQIGKILYVSLTWNTENRFGGGALTNVGLKDDGKRVLSYLDERGIAIDLSHTSDRLAYDILNEIDRQELKIQVLASHSNMRTIANFPRNLPDEISREIIRREGVIGLNFIRYLLGKESPSNFAKHVEHLLFIGGAKHMCFGADFFYHGDFSLGKSVDELFFSDYDNASTYNKMIDLVKKELALPKEILQDFSYNNFRNLFCKRS